MKFLICLVLSLFFWGIVGSPLELYDSFQPENEKIPEHCEIIYKEFKEVPLLVTPTSCVYRQNNEYWPILINSYRGENFSSVYKFIWLHKLQGYCFSIDHYPECFPNKSECFINVIVDWKVDWKYDEITMIYTSIGKICEYLPILRSEIRKEKKSLDPTPWFMIFGLI